jgi:hypothetical protein
MDSGNIVFIVMVPALLYVALHFAALAEAHKQACPEPKKKKERVILGRAVVEEVVGTALCIPTQIKPSEKAREKIKAELQKIKNVAERDGYHVTPVSGDLDLWIIHNRKGRGIILRLVVFGYFRGVDYFYRFDGVKIEAPSLGLKFKPEWAADLSVMWSCQRRRLERVLREGGVVFSYSKLE